MNKEFSDMTHEEQLDFARSFYLYPQDACSLLLKIMSIEDIELMKEYIKSQQRDYFDVSPAGLQEFAEWKINRQELCGHD